MILTIIVQVAFIALLGWLWFWGGGKRAWARDLVIPFLCGGAVYFNHPMDIFWKDLVLAITTAGAANMIRLGYGAYDPVNDDKPSLLAKLTKDKGGFWIRAVYGAMCGFVAFIPAIFFTHKVWMVAKAILFSIQMAIVCYAVVRLKLGRRGTDITIGCCFATLIWWLR